MNLTTNPASRTLLTNMKEIQDRLNLGANSQDRGIRGHNHVANLANLNDSRERPAPY